MNEFRDDIGKKIEVSITVMIFLTVVIKAFLELSHPSEEVNRVFIASSVLVGFYIISYGMYHWLKDKIVGTRRSEKIMDFCLNLNFILIGVVSIIILLGVSKPLPIYMNLIVLCMFFLSFIFVFVFPLILVLIFWIDLMFSEKTNSVKENKKYSKIPKLSKKDNKNKFKIGNIILTIIIIFLTIWSLFISNRQANISEKQTDISKEQTEILKISSQPYTPDLHILPIPTYDTSIAIIDRNRIATINLDNSTGYGFPFQITNFGKMDSGGFRIRVLNNWSSEYYSFVNFDNIKSGESKDNYILLTTPECFDIKFSKNLSEGIKSINRVPKGIQNLELKIECTNCNPYIYYKNISVCFEDYNTNCTTKE